jgi:hypothetical protein
LVFIGGSFNHSFELISGYACQSNRNIHEGRNARRGRRD